MPALFWGEKMPFFNLDNKIFLPKNSYGRNYRDGGPLISFACHPLSISRQAIKLMLLNKQQKQA